VRQAFSPSEVFVESCHRAAGYIAPPSSSAVAAAMLRASLDGCRPSWGAPVIGFPRLGSPAVTSLSGLPGVAAAADLLAQLSAANFSVRRPPISSAFTPPPPVNLLRF